MSQPQDHPQPGHDWNDLNTREVEETLQAATDLAYHLADDIGTRTEGPSYRDTAELASIEGALETELKQLEHLVDRTRQEVSDEPAPSSSVAHADKPASASDVMAEYLSGQPVTVSPMPASQGGAGHESHPGGRAVKKPGLVGVGTLGEIDLKKKPKAEKPRPPELLPVEEKTMADKLEIPLYKICKGVANVLDIFDKPFAQLSPSMRQALSVTALAAFGTCVLMFLASLLFS